MPTKEDSVKLTAKEKRNKADIIKMVDEFSSRIQQDMAFARKEVTS